MNLNKIVLLLFIVSKCVAQVQLVRSSCTVNQVVDEMLFSRTYKVIVQLSSHDASLMLLSSFHVIIDES